MESENFKKLLEDKYHSIEDIDNAIYLLKEAGASYIETIRALAEHTGLSIKHVQDLVINSPSWIDQKNHIIEFREQFFDALGKDEG